MTSTPLLDPEFLPLLEIIPALDLSTEILPAMREQFAAMTPPIDYEDATIAVQELLIPSRNENHQIRALMYRHVDASDSCPALVELHGGGHVLGSPEQGDANNRYLASCIKGVVLAVDYRLAPETQFPGPVEDCYSSLLWLYQQATSLKVDPSRLGVIGTSAGGGLAAALSLLARDRGEIPLAFQGLLMPMLDNNSVAKYEREPNVNLGQYLWTRANNRFAWQAMLGCDPSSDDISCYAAPARAESVSALPRTYISIGALDLFAAETLAYATRLISAGVAVDLHMYAGAPHAYSAMPEATATQSEMELLCKALIKALC